MVARVRRVIGVMLGSEVITQNAKGRQEGVVNSAVGPADGGGGEGGGQRLTTYVELGRQIGILFGHHVSVRAET